MEPIKFPPKHVCIVGSIILALGVYSLLGLIVLIARGSLLFDFGFIGIPMGYGLLKGSSGWRRGAMIVAGFGFVGMLGFGIWLFQYLLSDTEVFLLSEKLTFGVQVMIALGLSAYTIGVLRAKQHKSWFGGDQVNPTIVKRVALSVIAVAALGAVTQQVYEFQLRQAKAELYQFNFSLVPRDSSTGEQLRNVSYNIERGKINGNLARELEKTRVVFAATPEGMQLNISGIATKPITMTIIGNGYKNTPLKITKESKGTIHLPMIALDEA